MPQRELVGRTPDLSPAITTWLARSKSGLAAPAASHIFGASVAASAPPRLAAAILRPAPGFREDGGAEVDAGGRP